MNLTNVVFTFYDIQGEPIADTPFTIQLVRSGFAHQTGVVLPEAIEVVTNALGKAIVALSPSSTPYYVTIDSMGHCGKQSYRFFVPESDVPLNFQDLIAIDELDPVVITEEKIRLIVEATAISKESAANAKISETNAKLSETNSKASENAAIDAANSVAGALEAAAASAAAAKISEDAAKLSETSAAMSEQTANASAIAARASEVNAKASEVAAKASEDSALAAETAAKAAAMNSQGSADAALASKNAAKISETNAKTSETNAKASETAAKTSETAAKASQTAAKTSETAAKTSETNAKTSETNAKTSETAAKTSETAAKTSETNATTAAFNATTEAGKAAASATAAKTSETNAKASETNTSALKDSVEQTAAQVQEIKNDTEVLYNQALAIGSGWSPVLKSIMDGSRAILQITDWTGGRGTKPPVGYVGPNGVVATTANALDIRGAKGVDGKSFTVNATGTLAGRSAYNSQAEGFTYLATDNGMLYLRQGAAGNWSPGIPFGKGDKGDKGERGEQGIQGLPGKDSTIPGPANTLTIGTVTTGPISAATITGQSPNQVLNLTLQPGPKGEQGIQGQGWSQAQTDKLNGIAEGATNNLPNATLLNRANHSGTQDVGTLTGVLPIAKGGTGQTSKLGIVNDLKAAQQQHLNGSVTTVFLEAGKEYSVYSPVDNPIYEGVLPIAPNIGDTIVFHNGWGTWSTGRFTLWRGHDNHSINGLKESITFNTDAVRKVTLTYVWGDIWRLYCEV